MGEKCGDTVVKKKITEDDGIRVLGRDEFWHCPEDREDWIGQGDGYWE